MRVCRQTNGMHGMLRYGRAHKLIKRKKQYHPTVGRMVLLLMLRSEISLILQLKISLGFGDRLLSLSHRPAAVPHHSLPESRPSTS